MAQFSVVSSILSPADIAAFVRARYARSESTTCQLLKAGINHTYRIDSEEERFIFRIYSYNWRTRAAITEELNLLQLLKENALAVSYPIADAAGELIQPVEAPEGLRFGVLFSFAGGHKTMHYDRAAHYEVGKLMARIHRVTRDLHQARTSYTPDVLLHQSLESIGRFLAKETDEMQFLIKTRPILEQALLHADTRALRTGVVHLDIWFDNLKVSSENQVTLFDFDFCGNGWLCLDIAYYILQLHSTEKHETERAEKIAAFYEGYEAVEQISDEEKRLIHTLGVCLYYYYLGVQCSRFENWSNVFLNEVHLKRYINLLIKPYYEQSLR